MLLCACSAALLQRHVQLHLLSNQRGTVSVFAFALFLHALSCLHTCFNLCTLCTLLPCMLQWSPLCSLGLTLVVRMLLMMQYWAGANGQHASLVQAIHKYQRLTDLLQGEQPRQLLPPTPRGYILSRIRALVEGPCLAAFTWNSGGSWGYKPWSTELPTDSALVFYLFAAFLEVCCCLLQGSAK